MKTPKLDAVYSARSEAEAEAAYDAWASDYDADLMRMGYRLPWHFAAAVLAHMPKPDGPILDAGCGTGLQIEPLHMVGWRGFVGTDLSRKMLNVARAKQLYDSLQQVTLNDTLPFPKNHFAASFTSGTITPGHAPIETLDGLLDVTRPGGHLVFSLRHDAGQDPHYIAHFENTRDSGRVRPVFSTPEFETMPLGEPQVRNAVHIWEVLA